MQGQARRLQGHLPRGPPHCCSQGKRFVLLVLFLCSLFTCLAMLNRQTYVRVYIAREKCFTPTFVSLPYRLFWTTLESIQLTSVTSWLGRCSALVPSVPTSAGWLRCLLDSLVIPVCCDHAWYPNTKMRILTRCTKCSLPLFVVVETVPVRTVNRQCSSGLQAVADVAAAIKAGYYDIGTILSKYTC